MRKVMQFICERVHQTIGNVLRTMIHTNPPENLLQVSDMIDNCLATAMHVTRAAASRALDFVTPGALVFQRDMFLDVPLIANIMELTGQRQVQVNESLRVANLSQRTYDYRVGEQILVKVWEPNKLEPKFHGPYPIVTVHTNGTVTYEKAPNVICSAHQH